MRIKENEASFEEIADQFPEVIDQKSKIKIGPVSINEVEASIGSLIKVGDKNQIWKPKLFKGIWIIVRLDNILRAEFNQNLKIKLSLELGFALFFGLIFQYLIGQDQLHLVRLALRREYDNIL